MADITSQLFVVAGVLATCFIGPAIAVALLIRRKKSARARRRSPIGIDLLRGPGHSLRDQLDESSVDIAFDISLLIVMPLVALTVFLAQSHWRGLSSMMHLAPIYVVAALGFIAYQVRQLLRAGTRLDKLKAGYDAELAVGQELDQLMRQGAFVFHDVPAESFNIDHVVISPAGVIAVETKGYTKPNQGRGRLDATVVFDGKCLKFPMWTTDKPLEQADRQAQWLAKWLSSALGDPVPVQPVLALPGWFVDRTERSGMQVLSGKELPWLLKHRGAWPALSAQDVQRVAHQVEQRCRTVVPRYREGKKTA